VIFVTVGGQLPFDRLVHAVDHWASQQQRVEVFAQIGKSSSPPKHIEWQRFLSPPDFQSKAREAEMIIAHAGMGSILTALEFGKPIVLMPRRAHLGEHRNDHQWATVKHLSKDVGVVVVADEDELLDQLGRLRELRSPTDRRSPEYARLLDFLGRAIEDSG
jgi:UDP-N-acetylglucosamine transferase subunit ALG13